MSNLTLGNPSGNVFNGDNCDGASYPPVRRANKMSAMQIRFAVHHCKFTKVLPFQSLDVVLVVVVHLHFTSISDITGGQIY